MSHAISNAGASEAAYYRALDQAEALEAEVDRRSDAIREELESGDWKFLEDCLADAPDAQKQAFYTACIALLLPNGADRMRSPLATLAAPLQEAVALGIDERVRREIDRDQQLSQEQPWRETA